MPRKCEHPVYSIEVQSYQWTDHHPYGEDTYTGYKLVCVGCKKEVELYDQANVGAYAKLTGRGIDLKEAKALFKQNNPLFHELHGIHPEIMNLVMSNPKLEARITAKRKLIEKHKKELARLITQYNGGKEPFLP